MKEKKKNKLSDDDSGATANCDHPLLRDSREGRRPSRRERSSSGLRFCFLPSTSSTIFEENAPSRVRSWFGQYTVNDPLCFDPVNRTLVKVSFFVCWCSFGFLGAFFKSVSSGLFGQPKILF